MKINFFFLLALGLFAFSVNAQSNWKEVGQDAFTKTYTDLGSVRDKLDPQSPVVVDLVMMVDQIAIEEISHNKEVNSAASRTQKGFIYILPKSKFQNIE